MKPITIVFLFFTTIIGIFFTINTLFGGEFSMITFFEFCNILVKNIFELSFIDSPCHKSYIPAYVTKLKDNLLLRVIIELMSMIHIFLYNIIDLTNLPGQTKRRIKNQIFLFKYVFVQSFESQISVALCLIYPFFKEISKFLYCV